MEIKIRHQTRYRYDTASARVALLLRLRPGNFGGQKVVSWDIRVDDRPVEIFRRNAWGDDEAFIHFEAPLDEVSIIAEGLVETTDTAGVMLGLRPEAPPAVFLRPSELTIADDAIRELAANSTGADTLERLHSLSKGVAAAIGYRTGSTTVTSTAAQSLAQGQGVCQDHAHVFASAARTLGIPARYIVGYYLAGSDETALHETHAWAEAHVEGLGWVGFDSTNGVCVTDRYVRLCAGLDTRAAAPIRGSLLGAREIGIDADVRISEAEGAVQQQQ